METIRLTIESVSPLLMHAFPLVPIEAIEKKSIEDQAEISAYRDPDSKELYVPAQAFQRALVSGASYSKGKGRSNLSRIVAATVMTSPERLTLGVKTYEIDSRAVEWWSYPQQKDASFAIVRVSINGNYRRNLNTTAIY